MDRWATTELRHTDLIAPRFASATNEITAVTYTREGLTRLSGTITAQKPFFCVVLSGGRQWHVQAEWPDGKIEQIDAFEAHLEGVNWVRTQSEAWLRERENTNS
jgi:hypothetical protein